MKLKLQLTAAIVSLICGAFASDAHAADAKETWDKQCAKCHGADGKGQTKMGQKAGAKDYTDPKVQEALKERLDLII
jgi:cytochrome c